MNAKKNIDTLFQEKFQDFEVNPAEEVWGNIAAKLDEKKQKRVLPFWWKLSGIAALFVFGFFITKSLWTETDVPKNSVVTQENNAAKENAIDKSSEKNIKDSNSNQVVTDVTPNNNSSNTTATGTDKSNAASVTHQNHTATANATDIIEKKNTNHLASKKKLHSKDANPSLRNSQEQSNENAIAFQNENANDSSNKKIVTEANDKNQSVGSTAPNTNNAINLDALKGTKDAKDAVADTNKKPSDSSKTNVTPNKLEELLAQKDDKKEKSSKLNRWQLTSNVAPVFLGSTANGSPIDSTLVNNSKSYKTGLGFGLGVSYAVSKKLTIRTGLNKFNMSYNTNDIVYFADMQSRKLENVKTNAEGAMIHVESGQAAAPTVSETSFLPFENTIVHKNKGYINQEMGYLEMPLEVTYAFIDKRFGLKIIGGFSTLFLQDNEVSVVSGNRSTVLGEASNLNDVHFSTNIGVGLKYGFMKSFEFNVEPTFKYQINTFSNDTGNFKPYVFGIYSGISYKF